MQNLLLPYCIITLALSSFLLFLIQPLAAKEILPFFGGGPSIWNVCMVFFQGMLLVSYFYAYFINRFFSLNWQRLLHFSIILISFSILPILWKEIHPQAEWHPALNVLWLLMTKLTLPLFVICATAPLVQTWFSKTQHPYSKDPYFLYAASNVGSLVALLSFPLLLEPTFGLQKLSLYWSGIYVVFATALFFTAVKCKTTSSVSVAEVGIKQKVSWRSRTHWLLLSFAPSSLLMAVTQYLTSDIISVPFLWILPLAIYLLTFIIAFSRNPIINHQWMVKNQYLFLIFPLICLSKDTLTLPTWLLILFHLSGFFALSMVCLGELSDKRPDKSQLTEFYLWISIGGFLGGVFNSLIAPLIFNSIYEYHLAFCLCLLLRPSLVKNKLKWKSIFFMPCLIFLILLINYFLTAKNFSLYPMLHLGIMRWVDLLVIISIILFILDHDQQPIKFAANVAVLFFFSQLSPVFNHKDLIWQSRNFFGVIRVYKNDALNLHFLLNGTTLHGSQVVNQNPRVMAATTYYQPVQAIANLLTRGNPPSLNIAIAGLGTGGIGCQFRPNDKIYFYEIDPAVKQIAETPNLFSYLQYCPPQAISLGDARLNIAKAASHYFDMIVIDVFSSDAIPAHLFTKDAIELYLEKLSTDGLPMFNVSSRHINFFPVLASIMQELKLKGYVHQSKGRNGQFQLPSDWVLFTNNQNIGKSLIRDLGWKYLEKPSSQLVWTDDFSNILQVLK